MTTFIISVTVILGALGAGVAIWSFIDTRNKFYNEYVERKKAL